ncbi:class I SAM-dependent methyltransferase [Spirulina major]|uniref:class I SAM-dependent methyltransferase n=1 Tax=Spirulina major TaxID=270636 RepID=UPI0009346923|nr:class I SAM-dependent methyltransferase [Spirulina major]
MSTPDPELREKIRRQFDHCPYPSTPIDHTYANNPDFLYIHNLITAFYRRDRTVIDPSGMVILDAGCGSGIKALGLAQANPSSQVIGVDLSPESVEFAKKRIQYHGIENVEFQVLDLEDLPSLGLEFDYINCDEVLYLLDDPAAGLAAMSRVLKPTGILRFNLHSLYGRGMMLRAQEVFRIMGLMESNPEDTEVDIVRDTFDALHDNTMLKQLTNWPKAGESKESILANYLLMGDRGFSIPQVFDFLRQTNLEFISMVEWRNWNLLDLFNTPDDLPVFWQLALPEASLEDQLTLIELLHPSNRLIDLWCCHPQPPSTIQPLDTWSQSDWLRSTIHLHPQLQIPAVRTELERCVAQLQPFNLGAFLRHVGTAAVIDATLAAGLLIPLLQQPQPFQALTEHWQTLHPLNPITQAPTTPDEARSTLYSAAQGLEAGGYLLITP